MRLAVVGSRTCDDVRARLWPVLDWLRPWITTIVSGAHPTLRNSDGGAVDQAARDWARAQGVSYVGYPPEWGKHGPVIAPLIRNAFIAAGCDAMLAVWDGTSRGTKDAMMKARREGKPITVLAPRFDRPGLEGVDGWG